ncbi:MAG: tRNA (N(6)-L-threonylcarbamoyladenosine(37)-C(2))-methylthiotransferase MtaB [Bacilli bacterium]|nr:tRNA (N(6)-L-threonylcarbamoyladenosine(37)-C(2))-methylthiotransferase MtaB [Bacilli bacterium]
MRSVGVLSLGCKVNTYESEFVINELKNNGYEIKKFNEICDVYIVNTCTVTNTSDIKSRKMIRNAIKRNPDACVVAMGCFIEANKDLEIPGLDIIIGNKDKSKIVSILNEWFLKKNIIKKLYSEEKIYFEDMYITDFPGRTRAFVKIQDGCENFCSYCIIPYVRGKCRSKAKDKVISEITSLVKNGYKEIVLTGIHTGNYGVDLDTNFANLLKDIIKIPNLYRLRISSIEITELTEEVLEIIKNSNIIVNHLHIPLQAGSDEILKRMMRKYDLNYFFKKIKNIKSIRPSISISTDVIVGFPGESNALFEETIKTCQALEFSKIHVFPYSERKGTKAATLDNSVLISERKLRARKLLEISKELEIKYMNKFIGSEVEVLIEETKDGYSYGHTDNFLYVKIKHLLEHNTFIKVKITDVIYPYCIGKIK